MALKSHMPKISKKLNIALRQKANYSKEVKPLKKFNTKKVAIQNPLVTQQTPVASLKTSKILTS